MDSAPSRPRIVVVGNGMVGQRFLEAAVDQGLHHSHEIVVFGEEPRIAYDRVHLSGMFDGETAETLSLATADWYTEHGIDLRLGQRVTALHPASRIAVTASGEQLRFDECVLATGSRPFVPPIPGSDAEGVYVYRTIEDVDAIREAASGTRQGAVIGGGLLGLEAANALRLLGVPVVVVEVAPHLMAAQIDAPGASMLAREVNRLGIDVQAGAMIEEIETDGAAVTGLRLAEGTRVEADLVVCAAGIRPCDELGIEAGLARGPRGGIVVDDGLVTSAPHIYAIGEVACHQERVWGLVGPGIAMAKVLAARLAGDADATYEGGDPSTKLKLLGVDVASVGEVRADVDTEEISFRDPIAGVYRKILIGADGGLVGAVLVGDTSLYPTLVQMFRGSLTVPDDPGVLLAGSSPAPDFGELAADNLVCSCQNVTVGQIRSAFHEAGACDIPTMKKCTGAATGCGSCAPVVLELIEAERRAAGEVVVRNLCQHFGQTRAELFDIVRVTGIRSFDELLDRFGAGGGCEICKPAVASMLASLDSGYILDGEQATLQDTNDAFLANLQRDGSYSVVPRVPGGELTPAQLIAIGEVARDFDLYTKITGGQRIDLFGARVDQLPDIWARLIEAGFESGHAYGKALRTVKSCVGSTWCRYGVQDSTQLAIDLELRYRGLRAPHKLKSAVSGCARECAEAQSKDFGVIATERGWNLYVGGNGGMRPRHADLLASDLDTETLVRTIDRFLMYYVRTADRLERTATWLNKLEGGVDQLRRVVMEDSLGICAELDDAMARHVEAYRCEWTETLDRPERLARFRPFVNSETPDDSMAYVEVRGQRRPVGADA
jgi:nitrite reductase (NADH) large subunit